MTVKLAVHISAVLLAALTADAIAADTLTTEQFERIWHLNSQRNLQKRFLHYTTLFDTSDTAHYLARIDGISDKIASTSAGDQRTRQPHEFLLAGS